MNKIQQLALLEEGSWELLSGDDVIRLAADKGTLPELLADIFYTTISNERWDSKYGVVIYPINNVKRISWRGYVYSITERIIGNPVTPFNALIYAVFFSNISRDLKRLIAVNPKFGIAQRRWAERHGFL